jgi:hypothetical protein
MQTTRSQRPGPGDAIQKKTEVAPDDRDKGNNGTWWATAATKEMASESAPNDTVEGNSSTGWAAAATKEKAPTRSCSDKQERLQ